MLTHQSSPHVLLSDLEYLALKIAFNPGRPALWYLEQLRKSVGGCARDRGSAYDFIGAMLVKFTPGGTCGLRVGDAILALEVPTSARGAGWRGAEHRQVGRGYVITNAGLDIAREAAVKIGIDPDTIPW